MSIDAGRMPPSSTLTEQQGRGHAAFIPQQEVVGAAGRAGVHEFQPDAATWQVVHDLASREDQARTGPHEHDFRGQSGQNVEMRDVQLLRCRRSPALKDLFRHDDDIFIVPRSGDNDVPGTVRGDAQAAGGAGIGFNFHRHPYHQD